MALKLNSFFLFLLFLTTSFAQTLNLKSGNYPIESNIETISYEDLEDSKYNNHYYVYVHFERLPDEQARLDLRLMGFFIDSYINNKVYFCKIKSGLKLNTLKDYSVNSIFTVKPIYKLNNLPIDLVNGTYDGEDSIEVVIQSHSDFNEQDLEMLIQKVNGQINDQYAYLNLTTLTVKEKDILGLISHPLIKIIEPKSNPDVYKKNDNNEFKAKSSGAIYLGSPVNIRNKINWLYSKDKVGKSYNGSGVTIAVGEDGYPIDHIDFINRFDTSNSGGVLGGRALIFAGIGAGSGNLFPMYLSGASGAKLRFYQDYNVIYDLPNSYYNHGVDIVSTSSTDNCVFGYNTTAQLVDQMSRNFKTVNFSFYSGRYYNTCYGGIADVAGGAQSSKNSILATVGDDAVSSGSDGAGPALDGRIRPDISADVIFSTFPDVKNTYRWYYLAPLHKGVEVNSIVSGTIAILSELYADKNNASKPPSGLIKCALLNSADDDAKRKGPDYRNGWGYINAKRASDIILNRQYFNDSISNGFSNTHYLNIPSGVKQVKVMLYWNDKEAAVNSGKTLVNDLNLTLFKGSVNYLPLVLDHSLSYYDLHFTDATPGVDSINNAEQVILNNPVGGTYEIRVEGKSIPVGPQHYNISYVYEYEDIVITCPLPGDVLKPYHIQSFAWESYDTTGVFKIELSTDSGLTWLKLADSIPDNSRVKYLTTPNVHTSNAMLRISRNGKSTTVSGLAFMDYPRNVKIASVCPFDFKLIWNKVEGATSYDIYKLGSKYMDSIITVTDTFVTLPYSSSMSGWFAVQPIINGLKGIRSYAVEKGTNVFNCIFPDNIELTSSDPSGIAIFDCKDYSNFNIGIYLKNNGLVSKNNIKCSYILNNGPVVSQVFPATILSGDSAIFYFSNIETIPSGLNTLKIYIDSTSFYVPDDTLDFKFNLYSNSQTITSPHVQNFDLFTSCTGNSCELINCNLSQGWINPTNFILDDIDYRVNNYSTPSTGTGPDYNHTPHNSGGNYLYAEATNCFEKEAILISPCIDISINETVEASFWYHMNGTDMGELHVDIIANGKEYKDYISPIIGNKKSKWLQAKMNLSPFDGQMVNVKFRAITGEGFLSDIAIDDFELSNTITTDLHERPQDSYVIFPNPSDGKFTIKSQFLQSPKQIKVYDLNGRLILTDKIQSNIHQIDLVRFGRGIYFLEIEGDVNSEFHKLIHQF